MIEVVWAILRNNSKFLLTQRSTNDHFGCIWAFPGGEMCNEDTTPIISICRKLKEKINLIPNRLRILTAIHKNKYNIQIFLCNKWNTEPTPACGDITGIGWFTLEGIYALGKSLSPHVNNNLVYISYLIQHYDNHPNEWHEQWMKCDENG